MTAAAKSAGRAREGSPWNGLWAVVGKEMADALTSARMFILELLVVLTAGAAVFAAAENVRDSVGKDPFVFLKLFTVGRDPVPALVGLVGFLIPLIAIALGFDAINGEFNHRTMSRILAQPIYRDALLLGKFLARLFTLTLVMSSIWLLTIGLGILRLGIPPGGEEVGRSLMFIVVSIFYGGIWLALAMLFSITFRQPATSALSAIALWLFFAIFWGIIAELLTRVLFPSPPGALEDFLAQVRAGMALSRVSPNTIYAEAIVAIMNPAVRSLGFVLPMQMQGAVMGAPLPLSESILLMWPHLTGLIAATMIAFALCYVLFQRQEVRA